MKNFVAFLVLSQILGIQFIHAQATVNKKIEAIIQSPDFEERCAKADAYLMEQEKLVALKHPAKPAKNNLKSKGRKSGL